MKNRFGFGKNWNNYLKVIDDSRISEAKKSLQEWLDVNDLKGITFLDIG